MEDNATSIAAARWLVFVALSTARLIFSTILAVWLAGRRGRGLLLGKKGLVNSATCGRILSVATLLLAGVAFADPPDESAAIAADRLRLEWRGTEQCRPTSDVFDGLRRLLGGDPNRILSYSYEVVAEVQQLTHGWSVALSARGENGAMSRKLLVPSCEEVAQAVSLVISLWVQPAPVADSIVSQDEGTRVTRLDNLEPDRGGALPRWTRPPTAGGQVLLIRRDSVSLRARHWRFRALAGGVAMAGAVPDLGWGFSGRVGLDWDSFRFEGIFVALQPKEVATSNAAVRARFALIATGMRVALALPVTARLNVQPGVWALLGRLHGEASGSELESSTPSNEGWGAAGVCLEAQLKLGRATLQFGGGNGLPFGRPRFFVGQDLLYQTPPVTWHAEFLIGFAFP